MRFLIISDIHSNLEALIAVFSCLHNKNEKIDKVLIPGDIVGYGVNPNECCTIVNFLKSGKSFLKNEIKTIIQKIDINETNKKNITDYVLSLGKKAHVIAGNHDQRVIGQLNTVMASSAGISINWTKLAMTKTEIKRSDSAGMPLKRTIEERKSVKKVKLTINPVMTPSGRFFPPVIEPDKTIGSIGRMQGERIVTMPARNAKRIRSII